MFYERGGRGKEAEPRSLWGRGLDGARYPAKGGGKKRGFAQKCQLRDESFVRTSRSTKIRCSFINPGLEAKHGRGKAFIYFRWEEGSNVPTQEGGAAPPETRAAETRAPTEDIFVDTETLLAAPCWKILR